MKKVFAALAAAAMALSVCAFTGCDFNSNTDDNKKPEIVNPDDNNGDGENKGDEENNEGDKGGYREVTDEELEAIIGGIDTEKLLAEDVTGTVINATLSGEFSMGYFASGSASAEIDTKLSVDEELNTFGTGNATVKAEYFYFEDGNPITQSIDADGKTYFDGQYLYAEATGSALGTELGDDTKVKLNIARINGVLLGLAAQGPDDGEGGEVGDGLQSYLTLSNMLAMAKEYSINIAVDDSDGIKFKLSATEQTFWTALETAARQGYFGEQDIDPVTMVAVMKASVTFNTFLFDVYFSIDKDGAFESVSVDMDFDIKVAGAFMTLVTGSVLPLPDLTASLTGSVKLYTHSEIVTIPEGIETDLSYFDMTDIVIEKILEKAQPDQDPVE